MTCRALFASVLVLALPISVRAQGLEDVAARERDRRARQSPGVPSYDDYDLNKGKPSPSPSPSASPRAPVPATKAAPAPGTATPAPGRIRGGRIPSTRPTPRPTPSVAPSAAPSGSPSGRPSAAPSAAAVPSPPAAGPEGSEAYWRARARDRRDAVSSAERQVAELEARVNALRNDLAPTNAMQANREQNRQAALGRAIADLEQAQASVIRARQALDDLEDEARRKGALPGWLRER